MKTDTKNWQKTKVRDLLSSYIGGGWGSDSKTTEFSEPAFVIRGTDIPDVSIGDTGSLPFRYHKKSNIKSRRLSNGDIVFEVSGGSKGQWVGRSLIIKNELLKQLPDDVMPASFCKGLTPDAEKVDSVFFYYFLQKIYQSDEISQWQTQSTGISNFKFEKFLDECFINLPSKLTQEQISCTLSTYDDLIENNTRRIKILEEIAQAIYREWFVYFRFPGHEKVKMIDSKTEFGKVPEGWEIKSVGDLLAKISRKSKIKRGEYEPSGAFPVVDQGQDFIGGYTSNTEAIYEEGLPIIIFGDHTRVLKFIDFPFACGADGTQLLSSNSERMPNVLFFYNLRYIDLSNYAYARHLKFLKAEKILLPDAITATAFSGFAYPLHNLMKSLSQNNMRLRQARDLLLPKLVTGEIRV